jgi:hypothetical protein
MTDIELINSISSDERVEQSEIIDIVYEVVVGNMAKYDSDAVANEISTEWKWADVLLLLKGTHPEYEIISTSLTEAAQGIREYWEGEASFYEDSHYNFDGSTRF